MTQLADVMTRGVRTLSPSDTVQCAGTTDDAQALACISEPAEPDH
jgi:hypothetical protein